MRGVKYKGLALEGEVLQALAEQLHGHQHRRHPDINDHGYQLQASAMAVPKTLQLYFGTSQMFGDYGDPVGDARRRELVPDEAARHPRSTASVMHVERLAGRLHRLSLSRSAPTAPVFHFNLEMNF